MRLMGLDVGSKQSGLPLVIRWVGLLKDWKLLKLTKNKNSLASSGLKYWLSNMKLLAL